MRAVTGDVVAADRRRLGEQVGEHGQLDAGLAEGRQHLLDVAEEEPVGADDEHALALEREPVGVEEVGGAVQGDDGLAGARPALHDEDAGQLGPDDLVLLALDGGDDVGEAAGAAGLEGGDERAVAGDAPLVDGGAAAVAEGRGGVAEQLVLDAEEGAAPGGEVAAAGQAHGLAAGRPVEGLGDRGPPVDDDRLTVLVGDRHPPDVEGTGAVVVRLVVGPVLVGLVTVAGRWRRPRGVLEVDPAEHQGGVAQVELPEPGGDGVPDHVALEPGLLGAAPAHLDHLLEPGCAACEPARGSRRRGRCTPVRPRDRGERSLAEGSSVPREGDGSC